MSDNVVDNDMIDQFMHLFATGWISPHEQNHTGTRSKFNLNQNRTAALMSSSLDLAAWNLELIVFRQKAQFALLWSEPPRNRHLSSDNAVSWLGQFVQKDDSFQEKKYALALTLCSYLKKWGNKTQSKVAKLCSLTSKDPSRNVERVGIQFMFL